MTTTTRTKEREQFLLDLLTTAVEGGIGYWSRVYDRERTPDLDWKMIQLFDFEGVDEWPDGTQSAFGFIDWLVVDEMVEAKTNAVFEAHLHTVTIDDIERGLEVLRSEGKLPGVHPQNSVQLLLAYTTNGEEGDVDADSADWVVQYACFGEVIYG